MSRAVSVLAYIAQLASPPHGIKNISTAAITKILRFPGKSLDYDSAHAMEELGGLSMIHLDAYMRSCMVRAGHKTVKGFDAQADHLLTCRLKISCSSTYIPPIVLVDQRFLMDGTLMRVVLIVLMLPRVFP